MIYEENHNMLIPFYLMSSYAYYKEDDPILSDGEYDTVCVLLDEHWDKVDHSHKWCIDRDHLKAGTGYALEYPDRVKYATKHYRQKTKE